MSSETRLEEVFIEALEQMVRGGDPEEMLSLAPERDEVRPLLEVAHAVRGLPYERLSENRITALNATLTRELKAALGQNAPAVAPDLPAKETPPVAQPQRREKKERRLFGFFWPNLFPRAQAAFIALAFVLIVSSAIVGAGVGLAVQSPHFEKQGLIAQIGRDYLLVDGERYIYFEGTTFNGPAPRVGLEARIEGDIASNGLKLATTVWVRPENGGAEPARTVQTPEENTKPPAVTVQTLPAATPAPTPVPTAMATEETRTATTTSAAPATTVAPVRVTTEIEKTANLATTLPPSPVTTPRVPSTTVPAATSAGGDDKGGKGGDDNTPGPTTTSGSDDKGGKKTAEPTTAGTDDHGGSSGKTTTSSSTTTDGHGGSNDTPTTPAPTTDNHGGSSTKTPSPTPAPTTTSTPKPTTTAAPTTDSKGGGSGSGGKGSNNTPTTAAAPKAKTTK